MGGGGWGGAEMHIFITDHEHSQYNQVCYFHLFGVFLASNKSNYSEYI